jgi:hypothetical protein
VDYYYLDTALNYLTVNTTKNTTIDTATMVATANIGNAIVSTNITPLAPQLLTITYSELNTLDNIAKAMEELCPHLNLEKAAILEDVKGKYIYLKVLGKYTLNSKDSTPLIRVVSYLADDFGRLFTKMPPVFEGYALDIASTFQDKTAELDRQKNYNYWDREAQKSRTPYDSRNPFISMVGTAINAVNMSSINEKRNQYNIPYPIHKETSRIIIASTSLAKFHKDEITVSQLFSECKLYLHGVRSNIDMSKTIELSQ